MKKISITLDKDKIYLLEPLRGFGKGIWYYVYRYKNYRFTEIGTVGERDKSIRTVDSGWCREFIREGVEQIIVLSENELYHFIGIYITNPSYCLFEFEDEETLNNYLFIRNIGTCN